MSDIEVEYVGDGTPGRRGVWPEPGDRGLVMHMGADEALVLWRLQATDAEAYVWTRRDRLREVTA